jgi:hypothetical protein
MMAEVENGSKKAGGFSYNEKIIIEWKEDKQNENLCNVWTGSYSFNRR